jgi:Protein of unknwon function (DUF3310)
MITPTGRQGMHDADCAKAHDHSKPCTCVIAPNYKSAVDHPSYYGGKGNVYEAIEVIEAWGLDFSLGNAVKYIARAGKKDPAKIVEDLQKAAWYLNRAIENAKKAP